MNFRFAALPAKPNILAIHGTEEIDKTHLQVLHHAADFRNEGNVLLNSLQKKFHLRTDAGRFRHLRSRGVSPYGRPAFRQFLGALLARFHMLEDAFKLRNQDIYVARSEYFIH